MTRRTDMFKTRSFFGTMMAAFLLVALAANAQEVSKIRVGSQSNETSTTTANDHYSASTTSTREFWGPDPMANRPVELKELARALRNNVDLIYEYVHDNIRTEFMYGLKKGGLGAMIDQSGTPFDQAHLMVELLRESGYVARYKVGTLKLTAAQMTDWIGSSNTNSVRAILRDGGIPLDYTSTEPKYKIGHIWVEVEIPNSTCNLACWFDPSYKTHTFKSPLALETLMAWSTTLNDEEFSTTGSGGFLGQAWSTLAPAPSPLTTPVWVSNINYNTGDTTGVAPKLKAYASSLAAQLSTTHADKEIEDVVGGQDIIPTGSAPLRNASSLQGFGPTTWQVQRTWSCTSNSVCGIPDAYRTQFTLKMLDQANPFTNPPLISKTFFVDEVYGRRMLFDLPLALSLPDDPAATDKTLEPWCVRLTLDDVPVAGGTVGCAGQTTPVPNLRVHLLRMEVNSPYAAGSPAGSYMDLTSALNTQIDKRVDFGLPVIVMHGWGDVSPALLSKLSAEQRADRMLPVVDQYNPEQYEPSSSRGNTAMDHTMQKLGLSYLAQYSTMANLQKRMGGAEHQQHYAIGVIYGVAAIQNTWPPANAAGTTHEWSVVDRSIRINIDAAISVNSKTDVAADRRKVIHSTMAAAAVLEGSIFEQNLDQLYVGSTATRFHWGNTPHPEEETPTAPTKFYLFTTLPTPADFTNLYGTTFNCPTEAPSNAAYSGMSNYVNATEGMWSITAAEGCLGPGNKYTTLKINQTTWAIARERGAAFVAWRPDDAAVAHVVTYSDYTHNVLFKGGGAAVRPEYEREFDPAGAAGLLKDTFEDRSSLHGVNLQTGDINYSPAADISIGEGGFPYELSFQRSFSAGAAKSPGLSNGWGHNLDIRATPSGDGLAKMGSTSAALAAETIAALYTMQKIYSVAPAPAPTPTATQQRDHLKRWVLAPLISHWWGTRLSNNVVTVTQGRATQQYTRYVDDSFKPPRNGTGLLTQIGQRSAKKCSGCSSPPPPNAIKSQWDYSGVSFTYTSPSKEVQTFGYYEFTNNFNPLFGNSEELAGEKHGWHLNSWTFPYGVTLTFNYEFPPPASGPEFGTDKLVSVSNNLGRTLTIAYSPSFDGTRLDSITDGQGRTVQFGFGAGGGPLVPTGLLTSVTNTEGAVSTYQYIGSDSPSAPVGSRPLTDPKLWKVFAPSDPTNEKLRIDYDRTWRVKEYRDAVAVLTPALRNPYQFFVTGTSRGERLSPIHGLPDPNTWTVYYDTRGRAIRVQDELSRNFVQLFDNHDRLKDRTYPEGNRVLFTYDEPTQQIKSITQVKKNATYWSGALTDITVAATYDPGCGKVKTVTDGKGKVTTWNYNATSCTLTNVQQPQVANPQAAGALATPITSFAYNALGQLTQVTDPTSRVVAIEYDATTKYRLRRRVDPSGLNLVTTFGHNAYGDVNSVDGPRSDVTDVTTVLYDKERRVKRLDAPLGQITRNCFDLDGDVISVHRNKSTSLTPPDTNCLSAYDQNSWQSWFNTYTPTKKPYQATSPTGAVTTTVYDPLDRVDFVQDPDGRKVQTQYFADGKTKKIVKAHQSVTMAPIPYATYTLTPNGQIDTVADANGNLTNLDYDGHDRLLRTFFTHASGIPCAPALPHSLTAPSCAAGQTYEELLYDANGNITSRRNRSGNSITFAFDDLNRETTRNVPNNSLGHFARTLTSTYDLASRKWDLTADGQTISHRYDAAGRLDFVDDSWIGPSNRIDYAYDAAGNRTQMTWPSGGHLNYTFDALNRMDLITDNAGVQLANYDWDTLSRKDLLTLGNSGTAASTDYVYEADDDLATLANNGPSPLTFTFTRNASSQITGIAASDGAFLSRPEPKIEAYVPNKLNQIQTLNGSGLGYDLNGNLTSDGTFTFEYDEESRLRRAVGSGKDFTYEYDPLGRRRLKQDNGTLANSIKFVSDGAEEVEERDSSNNLLRRYAHGSGVDEHVAMYDSSCAGGGRCFYRTNWQGSTTHLINQSGSIKDTYHYGPYGERVDWTPADAETGNPFRYTGRRFDAETGLYYYRARYYSPKLGRFLQTDPIGTQDDLNLFAYVGGDPLNRLDPHGLSWEDNDVDYTLREPSMLAGEVNAETGKLQRDTIVTDGKGGVKVVMKNPSNNSLSSEVRQARRTHENKHKKNFEQKASAESRKKVKEAREGLLVYPSNEDDKNKDEISAYKAEKQDLERAINDKPAGSDTRNLRDNLKQVEEIIEKRENASPCNKDECVVPK